MFNMKFRSSLYQWNPTEWFLYWKHFSSFARNPRFFQPWGYWNVKDGKYAEITGEILYMTWRNSHMIAQHFHHDIKRTARSLCVEPKQCRLNESQMIFLWWMKYQIQQPHKEYNNIEIIEHFIHLFRVIE